MREKNEKNEKSRSKNHFFEFVRGWNEVEKSRPSKGTSRTSAKCIYQISTS